MKRAILIAAVVALPFSAAAQVASPQTYNVPGNGGDLYIPPSQENLNAKQLREGMVKFARCIERRHSKEANSFVLQVSETTWNALSKKMDDDCLLEAVANPGEGVRLTSNSQDILFALAEVIVQKRMAINPVQFPTAARLPPADPVAFIGECAVRANPVCAQGLLKTKLNSNEEMLAVRTLMPTFAGCLPSGMEVHPTLTVLRGTVAVNYYRLANAPQAAPVAKSQ